MNVITERQLAVMLERYLGRALGVTDATLVSAPTDADQRIVLHTGAEQTLVVTIHDES